jgi:hypothetical protein
MSYVRCPNKAAFPQRQRLGPPEFPLSDSHGQLWQPCGKSMALILSVRVRVRVRDTIHGRLKERIRRELTGVLPSEG